MVFCAGSSALFVAMRVAALTVAVGDAEDASIPVDPVVPIVVVVPESRDSVFGSQVSLKADFLNT